MTDLRRPVAAVEAPAVEAPAVAAAPASAAYIAAPVIASVAIPLAGRGAGSCKDHAGSGTLAIDLREIDDPLGHQMDRLYEVLDLEDDSDTTTPARTPNPSGDLH